MTRRAWMICAAMLSTASAAGAVGTVTKVDAIRLPGPAPVLQQYGLGDLAGGTLFYDNTVNPTGFFTSRSNQEFADDLHMIAGGVLTGFDFGYQKNLAGNIDIVFKFWDNNSIDDPPVTLLGGPYTITGLPGGGAFAFHVDVTGGPVLNPDVWMGMQIQQAGTNRGPLIYDPPVTGTSDDYYWNFSAVPPGYYFFGGNPVANFFMAVEILPVTPVEPTTWGAIKQVFAD